jgi:hypothetical protein
MFQFPSMPLIVAAISAHTSVHTPQARVSVQDITHNLFNSDAHTLSKASIKVITTIILIKHHKTSSSTIKHNYHAQPTYPHTQEGRIMAGCGLFRGHVAPVEVDVCLHQQQERNGSCFVDW